MALFDEVFAPYVPFGSRLLEVTAPPRRGTDVAVLQTVYNLMLATMSPPHGPIGRLIPISGVYDGATAQAVRDVQAYFALSRDGVAGAQTYFVFGQGTGGHVTYGGPPYGSRPLEQGGSGGDVTVLQNRLNTFRYASALGAPADGAFGPRTASALLQFKQDAAANGDAGLAADPIAGLGAFDASWIYTFAGGRGLMPGRNGFDVAYVQVFLRTIGLYAGPVHGYYEGLTQAAVRAFQSASGIAADGEVGPQTYHAIGLRNAAAAPSPLSAPWPLRASLGAVGGSGVAGQAFLHFGAPHALTVAVAASGLTPGDAYGSSIHFGTCAGGGPVAFALAPLTASAAGTATATTTLTGLGVVPPAGWFVTVDMPATSTRVACGNATAPFPLLSPDQSVSFAPVRSALSPVGASGASGTAVLRFVAPRTLQVSLAVAGLVPGSVHPAHIHYGTCAAVPEGPIAYPLRDLVANGSGEASGTTTITGPEVIPPAGWYVNVHLGPTLADGGALPIACGDVVPAVPVLPVSGV